MQPLETPRGTVTLRSASFADVAQFRELRLFALQDSPTAFSADYQTNLKAPKNYWEGRLKPDEHASLFFAEHEHKLIGMAGIRQGESLKTRHSAGIWGVYVRPEWRGSRIAKSLVESCIEWAKVRRVEIVKLGVVTTNASAMRCYERCGFKTYGTDPQVLFHDGGYYDEYLMVYEI